MYFAERREINKVRKNFDSSVIAAGSGWLFGQGLI